MNNKFEIMNIKDVFTSKDVEMKRELRVTLFYTTNNKEKEWSFILNLN